MPKTAVDESNWLPAPRFLGGQGGPAEQLEQLISTAQGLAEAAYRLVEGWYSMIGAGPVVVLDHLEKVLADAEHIAERLPKINPEDMRVVMEKEAP